MGLFGIPVGESFGTSKRDGSDDDLAPSYRFETDASAEQMSSDDLPWVTSNAKSNSVGKKSKK